MQIDITQTLQTIVDEVARSLAAAVHTPSASFVRTPLLYPSGAAVLVRLHAAGEGFLVTDMGDGFRASEMMGAASIYMRHAAGMAERSGIRFDQHAFFIVPVERDRLVGAVMAVANCALETVQLAAFRLSERKVADTHERLYSRLVKVFSADRVSRDVEIVGSSNHTWHVASLVRANDHEAVFEPVSRHPVSVFSVTAKFHDLARREHPPARIAVVPEKRTFGDLLNLLAQAGQVIDENVEDRTLEHLAKAA